MSFLNRPIRMAVFFDQQVTAGGGYQQSINAALLVKKLPSELCSPLFVTPIRKNVHALKEYSIDALWLPLSSWNRLVLKIRSTIQWSVLCKQMHHLLGHNVLECFFEKHKIDLVYFVSPTAVAQMLERLNYIATVWDLCHLDEVEFPEVRYDREFERRESLYRSTLSKAVAVLVDSVVSKEKIVRHYSLDNNRVYVMPFSPAISTELTEQQYLNGYIDIKNRYRINYDYIFYPAQFWSHKNHVYLLQVLKTLEQNYDIRLGAIFAGGDAGGNLAYVEKVVQDLGLEDQIRFAGFVSSEEIPYLYRQSIAMVMPTYFGPTNLPPLEAFRLGVPVLYPDKPGLREQVGNAALLMNLESPENCASQLHMLMTNKQIRKELIANGYKLIDDYKEDRQLESLVNILKAFRIKRECWQ